MLRGMPSANRSYNPLMQIQRVQGDLNRMFGDMRFYPPPEFPLLNLWTNPDGAIVAAEVPGVSPEELDVTIRQDTVTLRGIRPPEPANESVTVQQQERMTGPFARSIALPFRVDAEKVTAKFDRGIVTLTLPRPEEDRPHRVNVTRA